MKYLLTLVFDYDAREWAAEYGLLASEAASDFTAAVRHAVDDGSLNHALDAAWPMMRGHVTARTGEHVDADLRDELLHQLREVRAADLNLALLNNIRTYQHDRHDESDRPYGPLFAFGVHETLADGTVVYTVSVRHVAAVLPPTGEEEELPRPEPIRRQVGLVWESRPLGWCASPPAGTWTEAVQRAERSFPDRDGAAMFLYGFDAAMRWQRYQQALSTLPWLRDCEQGKRRTES